MYGFKYYTPTKVVFGRDTELQVADLSIGAGERRTIDVVLLNDTAYCALQTDISLPAGLTICHARRRRAQSAPGPGL